MWFILLKMFLLLHCKLLNFSWVMPLLFVYDPSNICDILYLVKRHTILLMVCLSHIPCPYCISPPLDFPGFLLWKRIPSQKLTMKVNCQLFRNAMLTQPLSCMLRASPTAAVCYNLCLPIFVPPYN